MKKKLKNIAFLATVPYAADFFLGPHILNLKSKYTIFLLTNLKNNNDYLYFKKKYPNINIINIPFKRKIHLFYDFISFIKLLLFFFNNKVDIVHSITPKAGLLSHFVSFINNVPIRIHTFTGQIWSRHNKIKKIFFIFIDNLIVLFSSNILVDGISQSKYLKKNSFFISKSISVINNGSICGVDTSRFFPDANVKFLFRKKYGIKKNDVVLLFLGRINKDKGVYDLVTAFNNCLLIKENIKLFLCGPIEDKLFNNYINNLDLNIKKSIFLLDFTNNPEHIFNASDIFCMPSYREGFGQAVIEASACCLPVIVSNIYGLADSFKKNKTGLVYEVGSIKCLEQKLLYLINNKSKRLSLGKQGRIFVQTKFEQKNIVKSFESYYINLWDKNI